MDKLKSSQSDNSAVGGKLDLLEQQAKQFIGERAGGRGGGGRTTVVYCTIVVLLADSFSLVHFVFCASCLLFNFEVPFKRLFAPTSQSHMSNIFRDSESLLILPYKTC